MDWFALLWRSESVVLAELHSDGLRIVRILRAVACQEDEMLLAVTDYDPSAPENPSRMASALLGSVDDGRTFAVVALADKNEEWVGVVRATE